MGVCWLHFPALAVSGQHGDGHAVLLEFERLNCSGVCVVPLALFSGLFLIGHFVFVSMFPLFYEPMIDYLLFQLSIL